MKTLTIICVTLISFQLAMAQNNDVEKKLKELGIVLPATQKPIANYVKAVRTGNLVFLAGHGPSSADGKDITGKVGKDLH